MLFDLSSLTYCSWLTTTKYLQAKNWNWNFFPERLHDSLRNITLRELSSKETTFQTCFPLCSHLYSNIFPKRHLCLWVHKGIISSAFIHKPAFVSFNFPSQIQSFESLKTQENLYFPGTLSFICLWEFGSRSFVIESNKKILWFCISLLAGGLQFSIKHWWTFLPFASTRSYSKTLRILCYIRSQKIL